MPTPESLLCALHETPDEDGPRLVYADWLAEHGNEAAQARGEFIQVQCRLARLGPADPELPALEGRERELLSAHELEWRSELCPVPGFEWGPFRRGFVETMRLTASGALPFQEVYQAVLEMGRRQPWSLGALNSALIEASLESANWQKVSLASLPMRDWPALIERALSALEDDPRNRAAECVVQQASRQAPQTLHPHLDRLFGAPYPTGLKRSWPWHGSGTRHLEFLLGRLRGGTREEVERAWECLLATRDAKALEVALAEAPAVRAALGQVRGPLERWLAYDLSYAGCTLEGGRPRWLHQEQGWHLAFPEGYFDEPEEFWLARTHPTWSGLEELTGPMRFGGRGSGECGFCAGRLHHLLTLSPVPADAGVSGLSSLNLEVCLSCLGWEQVELFYRHDVAGLPCSLNGSGGGTPQFPAGPLREGWVRLGRAGPRWAWQRWGSVGSPNLHRVGGPPSWVQSPYYPDCPLCGRTMAFLMQLDSNLPLAEDEDREWLWGSGGMGYGSWCDPCRVSGWKWQCT